MVAVFGCLGGAIVTILHLLYKISDGGVGKNGSSVAVSYIGAKRHSALRFFCKFAWNLKCSFSRFVLHNALSLSNIV